MFTTRRPVYRYTLALVLTLVPVVAWAQTSPAAAPPKAAAKKPAFTLEMSNDFAHPGGSAADQDEIDVRLTKQATLRSTVYFETDYHDRWSDEDVALAVGGSHAFGRPKRLVLLSAGMAVSPGADSIPLRDYTASGEYRFNTHVNPVAAYERQAFVKSQTISTATFGVKITGKSKWSLQPVFVHSWANLRPGLTEQGNAFGLEGSTEVSDRVSLTIKGGYGHEHILARQRTVVELLETLNQLTLEPGVSIRINGTHSVNVAYTLERKAGSDAKQGFVIGAAFHF